MPGPETYDYTQDKEFLQAPPEQQHAYLQHVDPEYAGAHPDQQKAYLSHINGGQYTEKGAASNPPVDSPGSMYDPESMHNITQTRGKSGKPVSKVGGGAPSELTGTSASPSEDAQTAGITSTALGAVADPVKTVQGLIGSTVGSVAGGKAGRYLGGDKYGDTAETIGKVGGGLAGGVAGYAADAPENFSIGSFKIKNPAYKAPSPYEGMDPEIPVKAHAEMEADIAKERQTRAAALEEANNSRAAARNSRTGDVATEGQQTSTGHSVPIGPDASEHYANRGANLVQRTGDVATEGQQMSNGHDNPLGPSAPTSEENLTRAEKAGKAAKVPNRMPRSKAAGIDTGEGGGAGGDRQAGTRGASEGRPATWTNDKVYELASKGNRDALMEIRQRQLPAPPNSRYVTGDVSADRVRTGPLALSTSETEHMPITPGSKVRGISRNTPRESVTFDSQGNKVDPKASDIDSNTIGNTSPLPSQKSVGLTNTPNVDELFDKISEKNPEMDRLSRHKLAEETIRDLQSPNSIERGIAKDRLDRLIGPEKRGPVRLGPEARGIK